MYLLGWLAGLARLARLAVWGGWDSPGGWTGSGVHYLNAVGIPLGLGCMGWLGCLGCWVCFAGLLLEGFWGRAAGQQGAVSEYVQVECEGTWCMYFLGCLAGLARLAGLVVWGGWASRAGWTGSGVPF